LFALFTFSIETPSTLIPARVFTEAEPVLTEFDPDGVDAWLLMLQTMPTKAETVDGLWTGELMFTSGLKFTVKSIDVLDNWFGELGQYRGNPLVWTRIRVGELPEQVTHSLWSKIQVLPEYVPGHVEMEKPDVHVTFTPAMVATDADATPPHVVSKFAASVWQSERELLAVPKIDGSDRRSKTNEVIANEIQTKTKSLLKWIHSVDARVEKCSQRPCQRGMMTPPLGRSILIGRENDQPMEMEKIIANR
jgi:hypothetical protein